MIFTLYCSVNTDLYYCSSDAIGICFVVCPDFRLCTVLLNIMQFPLYIIHWLTVLSVEPLAHSVVCLSVCLSSVVCDVLYCGKTARPSQKLSEEVNRKPGSKSWFFLVVAIFLLPVSALRPPRRPFLPFFARTAQQSVLDGTNGLSSSNPCAYCGIVPSELKPEVVLATIIEKPGKRPYVLAKNCQTAQCYCSSTYLPET